MHDRSDLIRTHYELDRILRDLIGFYIEYIGAVHVHRFQSAIEVLKANKLAMPDVDLPMAAIEAIETAKAKGIPIRYSSGSIT